MVSNLVVLSRELVDSRQLMVEILLSNLLLGSKLVEPCLKLVMGSRLLFSLDSVGEGIEALKDTFEDIEETSFVEFWVSLL